MPAARPGRAVSQYSCDLFRSKPRSVSFGAIALGSNHTQKARISE